MDSNSVVVVQSCDHRYAEFMGLAMEINQEYSKRQGYEYCRAIGNLSPIANTSNFNRYYLLRQQIQAGSHDWAFWIDADALIVDHTVSLHSLIDRSPEKLLIACRGSQFGDHDINNGVFLLNLRHPLALKLVQHCIACCERLVDDPPGFRDDQHVVQAWLADHRDDSGSVALVQCYSGQEANLFNYDGAFVKHVLREFGTLEQRSEELSRLAQSVCPPMPEGFQVKRRKRRTSSSDMRTSVDNHAAFQKQHAILVAAPAAFPQLPASSWALMESCRRYGIDLTLLGQGMAYPNHRFKIELVADYLAEHPEYDYVLQVDLVDVVFCATLREMFFKYKSMGHDIVASAERVCWPVPSHRKRSPPTGSSCRYLNSGAIFATRDAWLSAWQQMLEKVSPSARRLAPNNQQELDWIECDDQAAWSELYVNGEADITIDGKSMMFQTLNQTDWDISSTNRDYVFEGRRIMNRETGSRPCLIHANARIPIDAWANYVLNPSTVWMWPLIERIRRAPLSQLSDPRALQQLLLELGLHDPVEGMVSESQLCFSGKGLSIWQRPGEFANYLIWLSREPPLHSYLEIGVDSGGSFIATVEFLRRFHPLEIAVAVDPEIKENVMEYVNRTRGTSLIQGTQASASLHSLAAQVGIFDLILIDGDHSHQGVRDDWEFARSRSSRVAFHDIIGENCPGVRSLWTELRKTPVGNVHEFIDDDKQDTPIAGIGLIEVATSVLSGRK